MKDKNKKIENYLKIIDAIEKVRTRNNVNWMDILRLSIRHAPDDAIDLLKKVNNEDERISELFKKLNEDIDG
jgi:hypothetical protein